jgi:dUTP pyrophosphatase
LTPVSVFLSFTRSLVTSSAKIARTGYTFARDYLPPSPIASPIFRSTGEEDDLETELEPPASNGADPLDALAGVAVSELAPEPALPAEPAPTLRAMEELRFIKLSEKATLPTRAHDNDAGLDLYAAESARIVPGARVSVGTGLAVAVPEGLAGLVLPRSGLALKHGVTLINSPGLIDPGYRGEVRVVLLNADQTIDVHCTPGDRIAQLLLVPIATASPMQADALDTSTRGVGGFGSSGL